MSETIWIVIGLFLLLYCIGLAGACSEMDKKKRLDYYKTSEKCLHSLDGESVARTQASIEKLKSAYKDSSKLVIPNSRMVATIILKKPNGWIESARNVFRFGKNSMQFLLIAILPVFILKSISKIGLVRIMIHVCNHMMLWCVNYLNSMPDLSQN